MGRRTGVSFKRMMIFLVSKERDMLAINGHWRILSVPVFQLLEGIKRLSIESLIPNAAITWETDAYNFDKDRFVSPILERMANDGASKVEESFFNESYTQGDW